jgi:putative ABC transport system ATP-binding protein
MDIKITISRGEFIAIMGPSGSGKSTLLHILGILDKPSQGHYFLEDIDINNLPDKELSRIRNRHFGFVFQNFNLFPEFSALENVMMPLLFAGISFRKSEKRAKDLLSSFGMDSRMYHYPNMLSGGEQQRVGIARALANDPGVLFADEPTGNLPSRMGNEILGILQALNEQGMTIVLVTHDNQIASYGKRMLQLNDGQIILDKVCGIV